MINIKLNVSNTTTNKINIITTNSLKFYANNAEI